MHILKHLKYPVRLENSSSYLAINKWWCVRCFLMTAQQEGTGLDSKSQGLDWVNQLSFRLGSTATCHSSSAPARNHPISSACKQKVTVMVVHTLREQRESLLLRAPSPGTLVPLNHFPGSEHAKPLGLDCGHCTVCCIHCRESLTIWFYP